MTTRPTLVGDLMTPDVVTLDPNEKLAVADDVMRLGRIRHLPIVDAEGALVGIVSQRDLFHSALLKALGYGTHAQRTALDLITVREAMKSEVVTTQAETPLVEAAKKMFEQKIGCLVVMAGAKIAGILTEGDFVKLAAHVD